MAEKVKTVYPVPPDPTAPLPVFSLKFRRRTYILAQNFGRI